MIYHGVLCWLVSERVITKLARAWSWTLAMTHCIVALGALFKSILLHFSTMHCRLCIYCTHALDALFLVFHRTVIFYYALQTWSILPCIIALDALFFTILSHIVRNWWQSQSHKMSNVAIIVHLNVNDYFLYFFHTFMSNESFSRIILQVVKSCVVHVYDNCVLKTTKEPLSKSMTRRHTCSINGG